MEQRSPQAKLQKLGGGSGGKKGIELAGKTSAKSERVINNVKLRECDALARGVATHVKDPNGKRQA